MWIFPTIQCAASIHFAIFLIAIIFLVFDVELVLMFPFLVNFFRNNIFFIAGLVTVFLLILLVGLGHEWNQGSLEWAS